jgi:hypothetical protein
VTAADHVRAVGAARGEAVRSLPAARRAAHDAIGGHPASQTLLQRFFAFLGRELSYVFSAVGGGSAFLGYSILAAIVALVAWVVFRIVRGRGPGGRPAKVPAAAAVSASFDQARGEARRLAASDAREGLRLLYAALLAEVGRRRGWRAIPGRSNWTFVRRLGPATSEGGALAECTRLFESRVYGTLAASEGDVRRVDELADVVLA